MKEGDPSTLSYQFRWSLGAAQLDITARPAISQMGALFQK